MFTEVPEKLQQIIDDIGEHGSAELTRLTVLKKWFEHSERLVALAVWVAARAASRKGKTRGEAAILFDEARRLVKGANKLRPEVDLLAARQLFDRLRDYQSDYERHRWGLVRVLKNRNLLLIEQALAIVLRKPARPSDGYRLAAHYCRHDDLQTGRGLSAKSTTKILEMMRFMFTQEALEDWPSASTQPSLGARKKTKRRKTKRRR